MSASVTAAPSHCSPLAASRSLVCFTIRPFAPRARSIRISPNRADSFRIAACDRYSPIDTQSAIEFTAVRVPAKTGGFVALNPETWTTHGKTTEVALVLSRVQTRIDLFDEALDFFDLAAYASNRSRGRWRVQKRCVLYKSLQSPNILTSSRRISDL
jgi:hypothetical protein